MKRLILALTAAIALCGAGATLAQSHGSGAWHGSHGSGSWHGSGWSHSGWRGGSHFGFFVGFPGYFPGYYGPGYYPYSYYPSYGYPYYYPGTPVYSDPGSVTYIEQDGAAQSGDAYMPRREGEYSYYCTDPAGYYPQVQNCSKGWLTVVPGGPPGPRPR